MKKVNRRKQEDEGLTLNDRLGKDALEKLKTVSKQLKEEELKRVAEAKEAEKRKRYEKEKNKSFEELLDESKLDWKSFK